MPPPSQAKSSQCSLHIKVWIHFCTGSLTKTFNQSICFLTSVSQRLPWHNSNAGWSLQQDGEIYWEWSNFSFMQCLAGEEIIQDFDWGGMTGKLHCWQHNGASLKMYVLLLTLFFETPVKKKKKRRRKRKFVVLSPIWQNIFTLTATSKLRTKFSLQN